MQSTLPSSQDLREQFIAIQEIFAAREVTDQDRITMVDFQANLARKLTEFRDVRTKFIIRRRLLSLTILRVLEDKRLRRLSDIDHEIDCILENEEPGCLKLHEACMNLLEEFEMYYNLIVAMLAETAAQPVGSMSSAKVLSMMTPAKSVKLAEGSTLSHVLTSDSPQEA
jgi:hypothetical protein